MKKITIDKIKSTEFINFLKKLISIDKFVYFKFENSEINSTVYLEQHDGIKHQVLSINDIFEFDESKLTGDKPYKISFYNAIKVVDALNIFSKDSIKAIIQFEETDNSFTAINFTLSNLDGSDKIKIKCADPTLNYMDLTDSQLSKIFNTDDSMFNFDLEYDNISKLNARLNLDKTIETFKIVSIDGDVYFKSTDDTFSFKVGKANNINDSTGVEIYKRYLSLIDKEDYLCTIISNKFILESKNSNTKLTISTCIKEV